MSIGAVPLWSLEYFKVVFVFGAHLNVPLLWTASLWQTASKGQSPLSCSSSRPRRPRRLPRRPFPRRRHGVLRGHRRRPCRRCLRHRRQSLTSVRARPARGRASTRWTPLRRPAFCSLCAHTRLAHIVCTCAGSRSVLRVHGDVSQREHLPWRKRVRLSRPKRHACHLTCASACAGGATSPLAASTRTATTWTTWASATLMTRTLT